MPIAEETFFLPVAKLAPLIREQKLSPVELAEGCLDRLEKQKFNAVVTLARESALKEAREAEKLIKAGTYLGPLHGIPLRRQGSIIHEGNADDLGGRPV